jgi:PAS domain S-box-containing protein
LSFESFESLEPKPAEDPGMARLARLIEPGSLLEATPECLVVTRADGLIVFANQRVERLTGFAHGQLVGQPIALLLASDLLNSAPGTRVETLCRHRQGQTIPVEVHLGVIDVPERLLVVTLRDVTELEAGREARFEAEAKYRSLVEQIPAVVYLKPAASNEHAIYVSPQVTELIGVDPDACAADLSIWRRHVHPDDTDRVAREYEDAFEQGVSLKTEYRVVHEDGTEKWVMEQGEWIDDEHGRTWLMQGLVFDITERKLAEEASRAHAARLNRILDTHRDVVAAGTDLDTIMNLICTRTQELTGGSSAAVLVHAGDEYLIKAATGFMSGRVGDRVPTEGTLTGWAEHTDEGTICTDTTTDPRASTARAAGIGSMVIAPLRHGDKSVGQIHVYSREPNSFSDEDLNTLELLRVVLSSAMSLAAELQAKKEQIEALARFEAVYQGAAVGITIVSADARNVAANPAFEEMLGYTSEELASMTIRDYTHPDDIENNLQLFQEMMAGQRDFYRLEKRFYRKDGELLWGQVAAALERDAEGKHRSSSSRWSRTSQSASLPRNGSPSSPTTTS